VNVLTSASGIYAIKLYMYADIAAVVSGVLDDRRPFFGTQETALHSSSAAGLLHAATTSKTSTCRPSGTCRSRHSTSAGKTLTFGCYNIRSIANKLDDLLEVHHDLSIDVLFLVETWHDADSVSFRRLRSDGFQVVDHPRPRTRTATLTTNHGGVAAVAVPGVRLCNIDLGIKADMFELLCVRVSSGSSACIVTVVYRTGPISYLFFTELSDVLDRVTIYVDPVYLRFLPVQWSVCWWINNAFRHGHAHRLRVQRRKRDVYNKSTSSALLLSLRPTPPTEQQQQQQQQLIVFVSSVSIVAVAAAAVPAVAVLSPSSDQSATARPSSSAIVLLVVLNRHVRRVRRRR